jgi:hypothetical protein
MPRALQQQQPTAHLAAGRRGETPQEATRGDGNGDENDPSLNSSPDGVVLAVPAAAAAAEETEPATPTEAAATEKKRRVSPGPDSSRPLRRSTL